MLVRATNDFPEMILPVNFWIKMLVLLDGLEKTKPDLQIDFLSVNKLINWVWIKFYVELHFDLNIANIKIGFIFF